MRTIRTLVGLLVFALACGFPAFETGLVSIVHAEEEESSEPADKGDSEPSPGEQTDKGQTEEKQNDERQANDNKGKKEEAEAKDADNKADEDEKADEAEPSNDTDQDQPAEKTEEKPTEDKPADKKPAPEKKKSDKAADEKKRDEKKEQEAAEDAAGEVVSETEKAADEEEDAKAAEAEAAGADVEIDESAEIEEEPEESEKSPNKPVVNQDVPPKNVPPAQKRVIGATATIMEKQSELLFRARVDSGAKSCSLHIEDYKIDNESDTMAENIGKIVRFNIKNGDGESHWLEAKIAGYVIVKTAAHRERRYKVPLTFRYKDFEKTVLVTLNNREKMEFPLLLGRNFLMGDFVIDVEVDNNELHTR